MENQTESTGLTVQQRRKLQAARQKLRLCHAAEVVCARLGTRAIVKDVLKQAGMSRRSFYVCFGSLEEMCEAMQNGAKAVAVKLGVRAPLVPWMLLAVDPQRVNEIDAETAFERAWRVSRGEVPAYDLTDEQLLEWDAACVVRKAEAAQ